MCVFGFIFFGGIDLENGEKQEKKGERKMFREYNRKSFLIKKYIKGEFMLNK